MENNHTLGHRLPHEQHSQTHTHKQLFSDLHPSVQPPEINTLIDNSCMHRSRHPHRYLKNVPAACTHARSCTRTHACSPHLLLVLCPQHPLTLLQGCQYSLLVSEDFLSSWPPPPPPLPLMVPGAHHPWVPALDKHTVVGKAVPHRHRDKPLSLYPLTWALGPQSLDLLRQTHVPTSPAANPWNSNVLPSDHSSPDIVPTKALRS